MFWDDCRANIILSEDNIENHQETLPDRRWNIGLLRIQISQYPIHLDLYIEIPISQTMKVTVIGILGVKTD